MRHQNILCISIGVLFAISSQAQSSKTSLSPLLPVAPSPSPAADSSGMVTGKVVDGRTGNIVTGAVVEATGTGIKSNTDLNGKYELKLRPGNYTVSIRLLAYAPKTEQGVLVKPGETISLDLVLEPEEKELGGTVVTAKAKRESLSTLLLQQKNAPAVSDGISMETTKKTPDRSTADMLKRVSGTTVQDGKFAIIRGLAERYNAAFINGAPLPSSESDRKAFSFDFFPAALIDNIVILKTATPDKTGEFAGGIIEINTRDIPDKKSSNLSVGTNYHSVSTGRMNYTSSQSSTDWLGIDNGSRALPAGVARSELFKKQTVAEQTAASRLFSNHWAVNSFRMAPAINLQLTHANRYKIVGKNAGYFAALTYSNQQRFQQAMRADYDFTGAEVFSYTDSASRSNVLAGLMFNTSVMLNSRNKISLKNSLTINSEDQTVVRRGYDVQAGSNVLSYAMLFQQNIMASHQITGEHAWPERKLKLKWVSGLSLVYRNMPDYRRLRYFQPIDPDNPDQPWQAFVTASANPNEGGRFWSKLHEQLYSGAADLTKSMARKGFKGELKAGVFVQQRHRSFSARVLGYVINPGFQTGLLSLPVQQIFEEANMRAGGFRISENTNPNDQYTAASTLAAAYLMADQRKGARWRFIYGVRFEVYSQRLHSKDYTNRPIEINNTKPDLLPSLNVCYALTGKSNLRAAASRTVARPEFRELAPFSFFDFNQFVSIQGFDSLSRTAINNLDLRYELFPAAGQLISGGVFYKHFTNPIEIIMEPAIGGGTRNMTYRNVPTATNMGVELELRKKLPELLHRTWTKNLTASANLALIRSRVDMRNIAGATRSFRPLQGQSPYLLNLSLIYQDAKDRGFAVMLSRIGPRISNVGTAVYLEYYEKPRTVLDMQVSRLYAKKKLELKLTGGDLLASGVRLFGWQAIQPQRIVFYQPVQPRSGEQINTKNNLPVNTMLPGFTLSVQASWKF